MSDLEISCHLSPIYEVHPQESSTSFPMFSFEVSATFMPQAPSFSMGEEEDESWLYTNDLECETTEDQFLLERDKLFQDQETRSFIEGILVSMSVPVQAVMVDRISDEARRMASNKSFMGRRVLRMRVDINVPPVFEAVDGGHDDDEEEEEDEMESKLVPASKSSIEDLERVKVEGCSRPCTICLEEIGIGVEATRLPCSHVYHGRCICSWLEKSRVCPSCSFEIVN